MNYLRAIISELFAISAMQRSLIIQSTVTPAAIRPGCSGKEEIMKASIQPKYYQATVTCNCGNTFVTGSTKPEIHVEVCSKCHSFYTGTQKTAAAKGRIDKFNKKYGYK